MPLTIPDHARCAIPGCRKEPTHLLSLRMRRKDTGADWAPNTAAYFCTPHAVSGAGITVLYTPDNTGTVKVEVSAVTKTHSRTTPIRG